MKNVTVLNRSRIHADSYTVPDLPLEDAHFDLISDSLTIVLKSQNSLEIQQFQKNGDRKILACIPINESDKLLNFIHFEDSNSIVCVFANGDLMIANYDSISNDYEQTFIEIVGTIDCGIKSAKWSHDEEILTLVTNEHNLLLFSRNLDLVLEKKIDANDLNIQNQVSLGWGKEETQFKGRGAKQIERQRNLLRNAGLNIDSDNAILCDPTIKEIQSGKISSFDINDYEISWRGDCQYFAITCIEIVNGKERRVIRVYSREGELISCSEPIDGQEHTLSWKPQGSLIASTQRRFEPEINGHVLDVIFFEKNGLRHGEFDSRLNAKNDNIFKIGWSSNSEILLLQLYDSVQLWYMKNYHWYCKQEIKTYSNDPIKFTKFHPEKPFKLMIGTKETLEIIDLSYALTHGNTIQPYDQGLNMVVDGKTCLLTPFAKANVPPPMSFRELDIDENINCIASSMDNMYIALLSNKHVHVFKGDEDNWNYELISSFPIEDGLYPRQVQIVGKENKIYILMDDLLNNLSRILVLEIIDEQVEFQDIIETPNNLKVIKLSSNSSFDYAAFETIDSSIYIVNTDNSVEKLSQFPQLVNDFQVVEVPSELNTPESPDFIKLPIGLMNTGKLYIDSKLISQGVTSMLITDGFLLYTTAQHQLKFFHLHNPNILDDNEIKEEFFEHDERIRNIERGSTLVNSIPSKSSVILQAPRGNLETIYPRIMVLNDVRRAIKNVDYKSAFMTCRVHRIALDILHDYDPQLFFSNIENFIHQLDKVEYLDLFLSCLLEEDVCQTKYKESKLTNDDVSNAGIVDAIKDLKISKKEQGTLKVRNICDAILNVLINKSSLKEKYLQSIITAYASQKPPRTEEALQLISTFTNDQEIEKSVQHLCFLLDVNKLYLQALGIYNIPLALIVAQQSQKDPKEYLPFLQSLFEETELRRRFMVDNYLKKYEKALDSLVKIPIEENKDIKDEIIDFIIDHDLYKHALTLYENDSENFNVVLGYFADYLNSKQNYTQAAIIYEKLLDYPKALENYISAKRWREAISITLKPEFNYKHEEACSTLVDSLTLIHDYKSAAYISHKYLGDLKRALELYGKEYEYSTAIQLCLEEGKPELISEIVDPSINEGFGTIVELLADCKGQLESQLKRLRELREKKQSDPFAFYGEMGENENTPDNVSIAPSETSTKESFFTRYTGKTAGTAKTGASRRTAKNKRREERKRARGKKGTIYEEEYLISSVGRLIDRLEITKPDTIKLLEAMIRREMIQQAHIVQSNYVALLNQLKENVVEIYTVDKRDRERIDENGMVYYVDEIPIPTIKDFPVLDILDY